MKNEHNRKCCKESEKQSNPFLTWLADVPLNPFHMVSQYLMCRTFTFAGPVLFNYIPLPGLIFNVPQGNRQRKMENTLLFPPSIPHLPCLMPFQYYFI